MKSIAAIAAIGLLLFAGSASASEVTNVDIGYQDGATVARIDVQGPIRFTHETEVPKNGRPDRVIVDILSATHELGAKEFLSLPEGLITSLRTSQFAVTPEKIVRVVFDLTSSPIYKVDVKGGAVEIVFENKVNKKFETWSSSKVVAALKSADQPVLASKEVTSRKAVVGAQVSSPVKQNQAIQNDRLASLEGKTPSTPTKLAEAPQPTTKTTTKTDRRFSARTFSELTPAPAEPSKVQARSETQPLAVVKPTEDKAKPVAKKQAAPVTVVAKPSVKKTDTAVAPPKPSVKKTDTAVAPPKPSAKSATKVAAKPKAAGGQKALAQKVTGKASDQAKPTVVAGKPGTTETRPTARFRRKAPSAKVRGTMVAEFPKRLVIKYKSNGRRDPFASLIDNNRTYDSPVEARIPNVEGLKLVGVLNSDGESNRALFEDKAGFSYILKSGDKVRNGYVLRVDSDQVYFQIFEYGWSRTVALTME